MTKEDKQNECTGTPAKIASLAGITSIVGEFNALPANRLTSLVGAPKVVVGSFKIPEYKPK